MTLLFVILQRRVPTLQSKGEKSKAWHRTGTEISTRRNLEKEVCSICTSKGDERGDQAIREK